MGLTNDPREARESGTDPVTGLQYKYVVLSEEERAKGFVEPVRTQYQHLKCGAVTWMADAIAETYARQPEYYGGTYCGGCLGHFPVGINGEFVWVENGQATDQKVGTRYSTCRHCGNRGLAGEDHSCSCPNRDGECPEHD